MKVIKVGLTVLALFLFAGTIFAGPIVIGSGIYQQTENSPCVIGNPSCNQPDGFTHYSESAYHSDVWEFYSPLYTVGSTGNVGSGNIIPEAFSVGFDVNYAGAGEKKEESLIYFQTFKVATPYGGVYPGTGGLNPPAAGTQDSGNSISFNPYLVVGETTGNGYSDIVMNGFQLNEGDVVYFRASVANENAGFGQFFIIPKGTAQVPEPSIILLLGLGLGAVGLVPRRKK